MMNTVVEDRSELSGPAAIAAESSASDRPRDGFLFPAMLNGTYGLLGALAFSTLLGLRRMR